MTKLIGIFLLFFSLNSFAATQKIEVLGMVCAYCAQGIEKSLKSLSEVNDVYINLEKFFVLVESKNDFGIDEKTLKTIIVDAGYTVQKIENLSETIKDVRKKYEK
jgi:copper chaperone CopZ|tara:strand:- start:671 stop:985 length:315 start_codon:yes stop_codon:yes gene_type:complete